MSPDQRRQIEEARRQAIEHTEGVCATGEKRSDKEYSDTPNQINND